MEGHAGTTKRPLGIAQALHGKRIFITGATGFLGRVLVEKLLWSVQSEVFNPDSVETVATEYTTMLLDALDKEGLLRKQK